MSNIFFKEKNGHVIPIEADGFTVNHQLSELSGVFFVNWSYPVTLPFTDELKRIYGDLSQPNILRKFKKDEGQLYLNGAVYPAVIKFVSCKENELKLNFEFGIDSLPVFDKSIKELDLGELVTTNLYDYIDANYNKTYPEVNVVFPRILQKKYNAETVGKNYTGRNAYNDVSLRFISQLIVEKKIMRNTIGANGQNKINFIKPVVFLLHILKTGFAQAGYNLKGDILEDDYVKYLTLDHNNIAESEQLQDIKKVPLKVADSVVGTQGVFTRDFSVIGSYNFSMLLPNTEYDSIVEVRNLNTNTVIFEETKIGRIYEEDQYYQENNYYPSDYYVLAQLPRFEAYTNVRVTVKLTPHDVFVDLEDPAAYLNPARTSEITEDKVFTLKNTLKFNEYVPDVTFSAILIAALKLRNFVIKPIGKDIYINYQNRQQMNVKDLSFSEQEDVEIFENEKSKIIFSLGAPEEYHYKDLLIDTNGIIEEREKIEDSGAENISIGAYALPVSTHAFPGDTAEELSDQVDGIAFIRFIVRNVFQGTIPEPLELTTTYLYNNVYKNYFKNRLDASIFKWSFYSSEPILRDLQEGDILHAYQGRHKVQTIMKKYFEDDDQNIVYYLEIETEDRI